MKNLPLFLLLSLIIGCAPSQKRYFLSEILLQPEARMASEKESSPCSDKMNYLPDTLHPEYTPRRYLRVNFHVMNNSDSTANFSEEEGRSLIKRVMWAANERLKNNNKLFLPPGNKLPVLPQNYRLVLTPQLGIPGDDGIYFHYDEECFAMVNKGRNRNLFDNTPYERYGIQKDTVLNIFLMAHHPDSLASPTYKATGNGIARFSWLKLMSWYTWDKKDPWECIKLLHHEIGHCLGLRHAWTRSDGCEDTPAHPNCWHCNSPSPCDSLCSNNFMDYNAYMGAWSPCQIATIHANLSNPERKIRKLLRPDWCLLNEKKTIRIDEPTEWNSARDLEGHLIILPGGSLTLRCRTSLPASARIEIHPGGTLILDGGRIHNACGEKWKGIEILQSGKEKGELIFRAGSTLADMEEEIDFLPSQDR
jgi:hypothetical protein